MLRCLHWTMYSLAAQREIANGIDGDAARRGPAEASTAWRATVSVLPVACTRKQLKASCGGKRVGRSAAAVRCRENVIEECEDARVIDCPTCGLRIKGCTPSETCSCFLRFEQHSARPTSLVTGA